MDGSVWEETRRKMNPLFFPMKKEKSNFQEYALSWSNKVTDLLMEEWLYQLENLQIIDGASASFQIKDLESCLHKWSVESILASLFGQNFL